jgi:Zn-dependent protease with chaperone function
MTSLLLLVWAAVLAGPVTGRLAASRWVYRAPGLGVAAWEVLAASVLASLLLTGLTASLHWDRTHDVVCDSWQVCLDALRGAHGRLPQFAAGLGLAMVTLLLGRVCSAGRQLWRTTVRQRRRHAALVAALGRPAPGGDATVIPDPRPAAYLVPGRHGRVVVTAGAVQLLPTDQLDAVLAHEHAHHAGHHHRPLDVLRLLHRALPFNVFGQAHRQVARLVEMCADDAAARTHSRLTLARAVVALAEAPLPPASALRADGGDALERLGRLLQPPPLLSRLATTAITLALTVAALLPVAVISLDRILPVWAGGLWTL